jgi:hypothetical protein
MTNEEAIKNLEAKKAAKAAAKKNPPQTVSYPSKVQEVSDVSASDPSKTKMGAQ